MTNITVMLVDDHAVVREGYRRLLEKTEGIQVVCEAADADQAQAQFSKFDPDIVVMDLALTGASGIEATRRILGQRPGARVLIFSMYEDLIYVTRALEAGARGYVTKASAPEVLVEAVRAVAAGREFLSREVAQALALRRGLPADDATALTLREREVLQLLLQGWSVGEIAQRLGLQSKTVANHQTAIKQKLGAENPVQLMRIAAWRGLLPGAEQPPAVPLDGGP